MTVASTAVEAGTLPRRLVAAGLVGTVLMAVGGLGVGSLPRPSPGSWLGVDALASTSLARTVCLLVVAAGGVLLATAWWRLRLLVEHTAIRAVTRVTVLWSVPLLVGPPMFSRDIYAYGAQGVVVARGFDPYRLGPIEGGGFFSAHVDDVWRGTPSPYGPAYLAPASWAVRLSGSSVVPTVLLLRALAVLGLVLSAWALVRLATRYGVPPQRALWLGIANPLTLLHGVSGAHNDVLMLGLMLAGLAVALVPHRPPWRLAAAGALIALGALVKVPAAAALPALVLAVPGARARWRTGAWLGAGAVVVLASVPLLTGVGWGWLFTFGNGRRVLSLFSPVTGLGTLLGAPLHALGVTTSTGAVRSLVLQAGTVLGALLAGVVVLRTPRLGALRAVGLALVAVVLLSPTVLPWYLLWGVVPLTACVGRRTAEGLAAACLVLAFGTSPDGHSAVRPPLFGLPVLVAVAVALVVVRSEGASGPPLPHSAA
jgi:hypothetical protein